MGGAVGSKSEGKLLNRVEYRRLTRSEVYIVVRFLVQDQFRLFKP